MNTIEPQYLDTEYRRGTEGYKKIVDVILNPSDDYDHIVLERIPDVYFDAITDGDTSYYLVMTHSNLDKTVYATTEHDQANSRFKKLRLESVDRR